MVTYRIWDAESQFESDTLYYKFLNYVVAKDLHITAYIGKKINNTIAKCNIKLVREINSYRVCYTDTLINLNVVTIRW